MPHTFHLYLVLINTTENKMWLHILVLQPCHSPAMISLLVLLQLTGKMDVDGVEKLKGVEVIAYKSLASTQVDDETTLTPPTPQDVAIIM